MIDRKVCWTDVPKTGTTSIIAVLQDARIPFSREQHNPLGGIPSLPSIVTVRHPVLWIRSLWTYRKKMGWDWQVWRWPEHQLYAKFGSKLEDWEVFMEAILHFPNWLRDYFYWFTHQTAPWAKKLKVTDNLLLEFCDALRKAGVDIKYNKNYRKNESSDPPHIPLWFYEMAFDKNEELYDKLGYHLLPNDGDK